ncbi:MAG: hypothetical protein HYT12_00400 [Candidatus Liptonbacteria bacterium]|nr:hypothetical protein [Candidatus Liptonbacteria bacterium]
MFKFYKNVSEIKKYSFKGEGGQLMIVTVLILGGVILTASVIAGFLTAGNIRQTTLANDSAKTIFAADAGLERVLYACTKTSACDCDCSTGSCNGNFNATLSNGASYEATYNKIEDPVTSACIFDEIKSVGFSDPTKRVSRALKIKFE